MPAFRLIEPPDGGGWTEVAGPHATYTNGRTFFAWNGGNTHPNDIEIAAYVHATGDVEGPVLIKDNLTEGGASSPDSHNGPAILVNADGRIVVAYMAHQATTVRVRVSNNVGDILGGFGTEFAWNPIAGTKTYPQLVRVASGRLYLFFRQMGAGDAKFVRCHSDDGGETWSNGTAFYTSEEDNYYSAFACIPGSNRIDFAVIDRDADDPDYGLYHFYMDAVTGDLFKSDGSAVSGFPAIPSTITEIVNAVGGDHYPYTISYTSGEDPVIFWQTKNADPVEFGEHRWTGSAWTNTTIDTSDPISPSILSLGGGCHDWSDDGLVTTGYMDGSDLVMAQYTSDDGGDTWNGPVIISDVDAPNSPVPVVPRGPDFGVIWFVGEAIVSDDYDLGIEIWLAPLTPEPSGGDLEVRDNDDVGLGNLDDAFDRVIRVERLGYGSGSFKIRRDSPGATLVGTGKDGRMVRVTIPRIWDEPIFRFMIENINTVLVSPDETGGEIIPVAGRGALAYLGRAVWSPFSYVVPGGDPPADGVIHGPAGTGNKAGQILHRMMLEAQHVDRPQQPLPLVTYDFDGTNDSDGNTWATTAMTDDLSVGHIGENYLSGLAELWGTGGIDVVMLPDMELHAVNSYGRDLTGTSFGSGKVRFVKGVNIADKLTRTRGVELPASYAWVKGTGSTYIDPPAELTDSGSRPVVESYLETEGTNLTTLEEIGQAALREGLRRGESVAFNVDVPMVGQEDETTGRYLPGPPGSNGHYWVGDTITLHTGTEVDDFDDEDVRIEALTIWFDDANNLRVKVEVMATTILGRGVSTGTPGGGGSFGPGSGTGGTVPPPLPNSGLVEAHIEDDTDAHNASAVSVVPFDTIAATNVQDALEEIFDEAGGVSALDDLTDVTITSPVAADRLRYNGSAWVDSALIWRPVMALDPGTGEYLVVVDGDGTAVMAEG